MEMYIGHKVISATPMTRQEYNDLREWDLPENENGADTGYLIENRDSTLKNHPDYAGYISWLPEEMFLKEYVPVRDLTFGMAVSAMKLGHRVKRSGWNGKNMFLYLVGEGRYPPSTPAGHAIASTQEDGLVPYAPYIAMMTAQGYVVPWLASQTDVLGEDWSLVS